MPILTRSLDLPPSPIAVLRQTGTGRSPPGLLLCLGVTLAAMALEHAEAALLGRAWLEALVLAILLGAATRTAWTSAVPWQPGIDFSAQEQQGSRDVLTPIIQPNPLQ
ncbi:hypothetical protein [Roseicella aquatilis]|uniref:Uncharacterized protein n=1 Tax=Roseicella aquatilis TaxID=2527868 RepID=A0A4R4D3F9_9PROT|nr:hypothetical protein [Roseicella aquatilis]TCZ53397.1 hypothetical protein EXY23_24700 [Roseicella aquatilis]